MYKRQDVLSAIGKAGTLGTLAASLDAIADNASPVTVVVRVADGVGETEEAKQADQISKLVGTVTADGQYTGLKACLLYTSRCTQAPPGVSITATTSTSPLPPSMLC